MRKKESCNKNNKIKMGGKKDLSVCVCWGGVVEETEKRFCIMVRKDLLQKHSDVSPSLIWKTVKISILDTTHTHTHSHLTRHSGAVVQTESLSQDNCQFTLTQKYTQTHNTHFTHTCLMCYPFQLCGCSTYIAILWEQNRRLGRQRFGNILSFYRMEGIQNRSWDSVDGKSLSQRKYFMPTQIMNLRIKPMFFFFPNQVQ